MTCQHDPLFTTDGRCSKCYPRNLHQCGWCGEWYTGSRVDHGCPAPCHIVDDLFDESEDMDTDISETEVDMHHDWLDMQHVTNERARVLGAEQHVRFLNWQHGDRGKGCAGNDAETCEAGGFG